MRGQVSLSFLLVLLCASNGWTQTSNSPSTEISASPSSGTEDYHCTKREGSSLTVLMGYFGYNEDLEDFLETVSARFPCHTRQYSTVILDYEDINETITNNISDFRQSLRRDFRQRHDYYFNHTVTCNYSLLYGLKRALEISPTESLILVYTLGSMADYNDTQLLSEVYTLLEEKKSQVYFLNFYTDCKMEASQRDVFNEISFRSYGEFIDMGFLRDYRVRYMLGLMFSKPLNSVRILNINLNVTEYTEVFNVPTSLTYLLIIRDARFTLNITDPNGNTFAFEKLPEYYYFDNYYNITSRLIKSPTAGSWILNARGDSSLFVRILGFTGLDNSGNCSDSDCHPNATCSEFGGYGECTCKEGFVGDGTTCNDVDECHVSSVDCLFYSDDYCVNTIGSHVCFCNSGYKYTAEFGCVDIDECVDSSLNDCDPLAICKNNDYGSYTCTCSYGYYGDGRHCEVDECQQGRPCASNEDCMKYIGSYSCVDPCSNHTVLNDPWRSTSNVYNHSSYYQYTWYHCDNVQSGWYRFKGKYDQQIPEHCVAENSCGVYFPISMNGSHPTLSDGFVIHTACTNLYTICCARPYNISVKMCPEGFYVYKLQSTQDCNTAYCTESNHSCSGLDCAPDEECGIVDGVHGCHCKDSSNTTDGIQPGYLEDYLKPQVTCGLKNIEVKFSKCLLEKLGYNTSSIHLTDDNCQGVIKRSDKSYITFLTHPADGNCGGYIHDNGTHIIYTNIVYLTPQSDVIIRDGYSISYSCSYPSNMEINLLTAVSTYISSVSISVDGRSSFTITMGLFEDSSYTRPYTYSRVQLYSTSMLYVGGFVTGDTDSSQFVFIMKNCYATPTADSTYGPRYDIIKDQCPNKKDPTLSVLENGVSLRGRFSLQLFLFMEDFPEIYLHCEVGLCDPSSQGCPATCPSVRSALGGINNVRSLTVGPIFNSGTVVPTVKLFISTIICLLLLY